MQSSVWIKRLVAKGQCPIRPIMKQQSLIIQFNPSVWKKRKISGPQLQKDCRSATLMKHLQHLCQCSFVAHLSHRLSDSVRAARCRRSQSIQIFSGDAQRQLHFETKWQVESKTSVFSVTFFYRLLSCHWNRIACARQNVVSTHAIKIETKRRLDCCPN